LEPTVTSDSWSISDTESLKETTDVAKDLIVAFQKIGPRRSYFMSCSDRGREALMEAQRFAQDLMGSWLGLQQISGPT
jgi:hypothetical protein